VARSGSTPSSILASYGHGDDPSSDDVSSATPFAQAISFYEVHDVDATVGAPEV
jgi:hypothetical protein